MARRTSGSPIGDYKGRVGALVMTTWGSLDIIKTRPSRGKKRKKQSAAQNEQTGLFTKVNFLLKALRSLINVSFPQPAKMVMTPFNAAVSVNMLDAVVDVEGHKFIDYANVKLSKSKDRTQKIWNPSVVALPGRKFKVSWELTPFPQKCTQNDDVIKIVYCSKQDPRFIPVPNSPTREDLTKTFTTNPRLVGHDIFVYSIVVSKDLKRVAVTDYLGMYTVLE